MKDISSDEITAEQLEELDVILKRIHDSNSVHDKPDFLVCDLMEEYVSKGDFTNIVHIPSSYN